MRADARRGFGEAEVTKKAAAKGRGLLPIDLEEVLPLEAMRRIGEVGLYC